MQNSIVSEGKTTAEAVEKGLKELKVSKDKVDIKVLEEEKRSFYSILSPRVVKVELTLKENGQEEKAENKEKRQYNENIDEINEAKERIEKFLKIFLKSNIEYSVKVENFDILVDIEGEEASFLIGYRGETINAFQTILSSIANKKSSKKIRVYLDVLGYRNKRIKTLEDLADKIAKTVERTKKSVALEPMSAYERKIIHTRLQSNNKVNTISKGEEPYRKIVVTLK